MKPRVTIVIPVYNEGAVITRALTRIKEQVTKATLTVLIVYDFDEDTTLRPVQAFQRQHKIDVQLIKNSLGSGALNAIKTGLYAAKTDYVVVSMADLSDDVAIINQMIDVSQREHAHIVCASRYMKGGQQIGGPFFKGLLSRLAGLSLYYLTSLTTRDATNSFKLYRKEVFNNIEIESSGGFELGIELVVKAHFLGYKVSEVPSTWHDRSDGESRFRLFAWLPKYLRWYFYALRKSWFS